MRACVRACNVNWPHTVLSVVVVIGLLDRIRGNPSFRRKRLQLARCHLGQGTLLSGSLEHTRRALQSTSAAPPLTRADLCALFLVAAAYRTMPLARETPSRRLCTAVAGTGDAEAPAPRPVPAERVDLRQFLFVCCLRLFLARGVCAHFDGPGGKTHRSSSSASGPRFWFRLRLQRSAQLGLPSSSERSGAPEQRQGFLAGCG